MSPDEIMNIPGWGPGTAGKLVEAIHQATNDVIYLFDIQSRQNVYSSRSLAELMGYTPQQLKEMGGGMLLKIMLPDDYEAAIQRINRLNALTDGEVDIALERYKHADGSMRWFKSRMMIFKRNDDGTPQILLGISTDITREEKQRMELEKLALISQKTTNAIIITDRHERIEWINEGYEKLTGYTLDEVKGKKPSLLLREGLHNYDAIQRIREKFKKGEAFSEELRGYNKAGKEYWMRVLADPIMDEKGEVKNYVAIGQDVTDLKQNEGRLLQSYERLKQFAFFTSHQLRSPVADILSILEVFDYNNPSHPDNIRLLKDLKTVSERLDDVVHEMNDILSTNGNHYTQQKQSTPSLQHIMLVDDDNVFNNITGMILKRLDKKLDIQTYTDPCLALDTLVQHESQPDAIFLDINMPEINGWEFLEKLDENGLDVDVYMLTSSIDPADKEKSKTYPRVKGYFTKPLTQKVLTEYFKFTA